MKKNYLDTKIDTQELIGADSRGLTKHALAARKNQEDKRIGQRMIIIVISFCSANQSLEMLLPCGPCFNQNNLMCSDS